MSSIPMATFSTKSVHEIIKKQMQQEDSKYRGTSKGLTDEAPKSKLGEMPHNYNFKFMKSIWGLYNQFAPQAFQKNEELACL